MKRIIAVLSLASVLFIVGARVGQPEPQTPIHAPTPHEEQQHHHQHFEHEMTHSSQH